MQSEIFKVIRDKDFDKVKELVEKYEDVNVENNGRTFLIFLCGLHTNDKEVKNAYENEILKVIKLLIGKGANVNIEDRNGKTALFWACENGYLDIVNLLINNGANVNVRDTTLTEACMNNHYNLFDLIVDDDAIIEKVDYKTGTSPLMKACMNNHFEIVKFLIENGANVNAKNEVGNTPLMYSNNIDITKILVNKGADVNVRNKYQTTPLMRVSNIETAKFLITEGAIVDSQDDIGKTALMIAVELEDFETAKFLITEGADINIKDNKGKSILMYAKTEELKNVLNSYK